ncbi:MAG: redox-regulated ATPase YchF [Euryarchaeota archaeon]|nr:redox-regulated ATPase YchF [Euryarchaeota archaeon]
MALTIGLVGKPNVGKSTFFSAATAAKAEVANYPFTTIDPNKGVTYVRTPCPHVALGVTCTPGNAPCDDGTRLVPIELIDVAGLVPDAHKGKGLGVKFLDDLRQASALIHVVDLAGATDAEGNPVDAGTHDPEEDIAFLEREIDHWLAGILGDKWERTAKAILASGGKTGRAIAERLSGLGVKESHVSAALTEAGVDREKPQLWSEEDLVKVATGIRRRSKPILIAGNKADQADPETVGRIERACEARRLLFVPCSAESELALRNGAKAGVLDYTPGDKSFDITSDKLSDKQKQALEYVRSHVLGPYGGTGVTGAVKAAAYDLLDLITAFPVEDEHKYTDKQGRVLPDAFMVPRGTTAKEFAFKVHTELGERFIRAVDAKTRRVVGADHEVQDGDVIRIVADA